MRRALIVRACVVATRWLDSVTKSGLRKTKQWSLFPGTMESLERAGQDKHYRLCVMTSVCQPGAKWLCQYEFARPLTRMHIPYNNSSWTVLCAVLWLGPGYSTHHAELLSG